MICERCNKRTASMRVTVRTPAGEENHFLCPICALTLPSFYSPSAAKKPRTAVCPDCGLELARFQETGRLGCARCYETFAPELAEILLRVQGTDRHKLPQAEEAADKVTLRRLLKEAVAREDYEVAARLRDQIRELEATHE